MRITNTMMSNKMMSNINRNGTLLDSLYTQYASGKKIQYPSENPIIASRALKFRTTVAENLQYQKNVAQGLSWMEVTENGYSEVNKILEKIRDLAVQGDGAESYTEKQALATQVQSLKEQLGLIMNSSYTGRYLFSGFRTDQPGVLLESDQTLTFTDIKQTLTSKDIEQISAIQKLDDASEPTITDASILKLPYKYCENIEISVDGGAAVTVQTMSKDDASAYKPAADEIYYIEETGELVLGADYKNSKTFDVTYDKTGFEKGELNPMVYFTCTDSNGITYTMDNQDIMYEFSVGTQFAVNSLAKDIITPQMYADIMNFCDTILNVTLSEKSDIIAKLSQDPSNKGKTQSELSALADEQISREKEKLETALQTKFSNMIALMDKHSAAVSKSHTDLGARMNRLDLIQSRLEEEETSYTKLLSENEDADLMEVAMFLNNAESVYQASLQAGMNMIQLSLANFL